MGVRLCFVAAAIAVSSQTGETPAPVPKPTRFILKAACIIDVGVRRHTA